MKEILVLTTEGEVSTEVFPTDLTRMQSIVGGYIEEVRIRDNLFMIVNEEGHRRQLATNPIASRFYPGPSGILGDVFFCSVGYTKNGPDLCGLSDHQMMLLKGLIQKIKDGVV